MKILRSGIAALVAICLSSCCFLGLAYERKLDGPYWLAATDSMEQMILCRKSRYSCAPVGPPATVVAAGWDKSYIVIETYPDLDDGRTDLAEDRYHYITRSPEDTDLYRDVSLTGPLDEAAYQQEKARLDLPEFEIVFEELKSLRPSAGQKPKES